MNLLKSQVQRQQQIEQVSKNAMANGLPVSIPAIESKSPQQAGKSPRKVGEIKKLSTAATGATMTVDA